MTLKLAIATARVEHVMTQHLDLDLLERFITKYDCEEWNAETGHALLAELREARTVLERRCVTCAHCDNEPRTSRWHGILNGPFCAKAGRRISDDTPNDDDGEPIVVRCETLGNGCLAWTAWREGQHES